MIKNNIIALMVVFFFSLPLLVSSQERADSVDRSLKSAAAESGEIADFTITDSDGYTWNLYEQLDAGKTVVLDLFFST